MKRHHLLGIFACSLFMAASFSVPLGVAQDKEDAKPAVKKSDTADADADAKKSPETVAVKKEDFKIEVTVKGVFDAANKSEISLEPETWSTFKLKEDPAEHGSIVSEGDVLMTFETEDYEEQLADAQDKYKLAEIALSLGKLSVAQLDQTTPMNLKIAQRQAKESADDYKYFLEVEEPQRKKMVEFSLKSSKQMLEYYKEEYDQLKKMYEADDLTEETEEIVLRRAKDSYEQAQFMLERAKLQYDRTMNTTLPRDRVRQEEGQVRSKLSLEKAKLSLPAALVKAKLELKQQTVAFNKAKEKLDELKKDKGLFVVKAPADGVLYYGQITDGKLATASTVSKLMKAGKSVTPKAVVMTILPETATRVVTTVEEKDLHQVSKGQTVAVTPTAYPDMKLTGKIDSLSRFPNASSKYDATITLTGNAKKWSQIVPGMTCESKIQAYNKKNALVLPKASVFSDDDETHYVFVASEKGKPKKTNVETGKTSGDNIEILSGVTAKQKVLKSKP